MKILIIDDEKELCSTLEKYLAKKGHQVRVANDFKTADEALLLDRFQVIFLDFRISNQHTGRDFIIHAKRLKVDTPIVMMSAYKTRDNELEMRNLGVQHYLAKPFTLAEVDAVLSQIPS
jgi:DNA-binding response OmpR family regulator